MDHISNGPYQILKRTYYQYQSQDIETIKGSEGQRDH